MGLPKVRPLSSLLTGTSVPCPSSLLSTCTNPQDLLRPKIRLDSYKLTVDLDQVTGPCQGLSVLSSWDKPLLYRSILLE